MGLSIKSCIRETSQRASAFLVYVPNPQSQQLRIRSYQVSLLVLHVSLNWRSDLIEASVMNLFSLDLRTHIGLNFDSV